jgi:prepilin-type N-terminal cleavage/methylation domain-containing protein
VKQGTRNPQQGYSLIEMMMVLFIAVVSAGIAIPTTANTIANIKLRGAAASFSGLVQQARLAAVQKNATYIVRFGLPSGQGAYAEKIDLSDPNYGSYTTGEPMVQFGGNVNQVAAPSGSPSKLDGAGSALGWTATSGDLSFNSRGLPCNASTTPCGTNVNYVFYFSDTRAFGNQGWAAVSITAAGRTQVWFWSGSKWIN